MSGTGASTSRPTGVKQAFVNGICEMTLEARDPSALEEFYRRAFGCPVIARQDDRVWLECGSHTRLGIWKPGEKELGDEGGRHVHFAMSVRRGELVALCARFTDEGIEHRGPVEHPGGDMSVYVEDPQRNVVEIWDFFEHGAGARERVDALT